MRVEEAGGRIYAEAPVEKWRTRFLYRVTVGTREIWTFHEWLAKPGILRKVNGAHGCCAVCGHMGNPAREEPSLEWEVEQFSEKPAPPDPIEAPHAPEPRRPRRHKDTKRWCRGKIGVPHQTAWRPTRPDSETFELICGTSGRKLDWCSHAGWWPKRAACRCGFESRAKEGVKSVLI